MVLYNLGANRSAIPTPANIHMQTKYKFLFQFSSFWPLLLGLPNSKGESRRDGRVWGVKRKLPLLGQWTGSWPWGWGYPLARWREYFFGFFFLETNLQYLTTTLPSPWASDQEWPQTDGSGWFLPDYIYGLFNLIFCWVLITGSNIFSLQLLKAHKPRRCASSKLRTSDRLADWR